MEAIQAHHPFEGRGQRQVQRAYDLALIITSIALPFSNFLMSQGAFLLLFAWGLDRWHNGPIFRGRTWKFWRSQPILWAILALFTWHLAGQFWTNDLAHGWRALRIQLPLLAFPLVLITGRWNQSRGLELVQHILGFSVVTACIAALWSGSSADKAVEARDWSPFISHIRFSLMIAFIGSWWLLRSITTRSVKAWGITLIIGLVGAAFTWKSASITGAILLPLSALVAYSVTHNARERSPHGKNLLIGLAGLFIAGTLWTISSIWPQYPDANTLKTNTVQGATYQHFPERCMRENGQHVWTNIAWDELRESWSHRSAIPFDGKDERDQELKMTLLRYMTSLGLTKDRSGIEALQEIDIANIHSGIPTILELQHGGLKRRWDIVQFEIWNALDGGNPSGHSLVQRFLFIKNALYIFQKHPALGVGAGDVSSEIAMAYTETNSPLKAVFRLRPHNQYITFLISGGPLSMLLWIAILIALVSVSTEVYPTYPRQIAFLACFIIALSCLTEDTLETQAGVTFAGFLIGLTGRRNPL